MLLAVSLTGCTKLTTLLWHSELEAESVDTITCMSVTKWIHLHGGDAAMHTLFSRVQKALGPGGYLILEPQPWKSYKQALRKLVQCALC